MIRCNLIIKVVVVILISFDLTSCSVSENTVEKEKEDNIDPKAPSEVVNSRIALPEEFNGSKTDSVKYSKNISNSDHESIGHQSHILFLTYLISKNDNRNEYEVRLLKKIYSEGVLKQSDSNLNNTQVGDLSYSVLDVENNVVSRGYLPNPLRRAIEFVNSEGILEKRTVEFESEEFLVRIQIPQEAKSVVLEKYMGSDQNNMHLITTIL